MSLLRCPKFLRCLTADAGNFDRGHSLTSLLLPLAALGSLPTASVRTGLAMTGFYKGAVCGGTHGSRPTTGFCRARVPYRECGTSPPGRTEAPAPTECNKKCGGAGRCRHRPLRKRNKRCNGRATARVAPTGALQGVRRGERNPPVTASPCQPPLGKGAKGTGDADCHECGAPSQ